MSSSALKPECDWARVVKAPSTNEPIPDPRSAASTGPFALGRSTESIARWNSASVTSAGDFVIVVISLSSFSRDRGDFIDERAEDARDGRGAERDDEECDEHLSHPRLFREARA